MPDGDGTSSLEDNWSLIVDAQRTESSAELSSLNPSQVSLLELETPGWPTPEVFAPDLENAVMHNIEPIAEELPQHVMYEM